MRFFFDTHAILGVLFGEPAYARHAGAEGVTHLANLLEAYVVLVRQGDSDPVKQVRRLGLGLAEASEAALIAAARLKVAAAKRKLSLVDALGYAVASELGLRFLTGDPGFDGMAGVEFVAAAT